MRLRRTTLITLGCSAILAGLALSKLGFSYWWLAALAGLLINRKKDWPIILFVLIGFMLGLWRGNIYVAELNYLKALSNRQVIVSVTAKSDAVYGSNSQIEFTAGGAKLDSSQPLAGSFKINGFGAGMVYRGDKIIVRGKLY